MNKFLVFIGFVLGLTLFSCNKVPKDVNLSLYKHQEISGTIYVDNSIENSLKKPYFLIISVSSPTNPMPIAVKQVKNPSFPYKFYISGKDKIRDDVPLYGDVLVKARISSKMGASVSSSDYFGIQNAKAGDKDVKIFINKRV